MDKDLIKEIGAIVQESSQGNWIPFGIVAACLGLVVVLFIYILNLKDKDNKKHHDKTDELFEKIADNQSSMNTMIAIHENEIQNLKKDT